MPNVGKPSKGCKNCRGRKVKCDQKRPSCGQCLRIGKECHGYRDPLQMMFKNESDVVARKANMRYQELSKGKSPISSRWKRSHTSDNDSTSSGASPASSTTSNHQFALRTGPSAHKKSMTRELMPPLEDQAVGFFFSNYVLTPTLVPRGQFDYLHELVNQHGAEKILQTAVTAAGLAGLGNATKCPHISKKAREEYVTALRMTNKALTLQETATKDSTLISVLMLGMYENFTFQTKDSQKAWTEHINGATTLINLRGIKQFYQSVSRRIFQQFYGTALLTCLQNRVAVPTGMTELWEAGTQINDYSIPGKEWTTCMIRFMLRVINLSGDSDSDPASMVASATKLDRELDTLKALIPNIWKYETVVLEEPLESVHSGFYHIYLDPWIIQMWNHLRSVRLNLHKLIREQLLKSLDQAPTFFDTHETGAQILISEQVMRTAAMGICATVPQVTGQIPFPVPSATTAVYADSAKSSDLFDIEDPRFKIHPPGTFLNPSRPTGMAYLIWPLYAAGVMDLCSEGMRDWVIDRLFYLGLKIGTRQAVVFAEELRE
ncbi:uncharacterized protein BDR25DRAFT_167916, partial [Lindgomyces ingoldianus]